MIGALIGAGASLLGGLFGKKKAKQPETTTQIVKNEVDYQQMVESAEAAGFNPLTALRNGGSAGFGSGTTTTTHPGLSGNADIAQSLGQFAGAIGDYFDPMARKQRQVESALMDYQLSTLQNKPKAAMMFGDVPMKAGSSLVSVPKAALSAGGRSAPSVSGRLLSSASSGVGSFKPLVAGDAPTVSSMGMRSPSGRYGWFENPWMPDAEIVETGYSDLGSALYTAPKLLVDAAYSAHKNRKHAVEDFGKYWDSAKKEYEKREKAFSSDFNANLDRMFGADYRRGLSNPPKTTW